jgi:hypothetical protein
MTYQAQCANCGQWRRISESTFITIRDKNPFRSGLLLLCPCGNNLAGYTFEQAVEEDTD